LAAISDHTFCPPSRILARRLPAVASVAQRLAVAYVIPLTATADRHDMVRLCLTLVIAHTPALLARPGVT
jgi:hypothetical protein